MLDMILRKKGFNCDQCADGSEAVKLIQDRGCDYYDLIFMDSVMPIMVILFPSPAVACMLTSLGLFDHSVGQRRRKS